MTTLHTLGRNCVSVGFPRALRGSAGIPLLRQSGTLLLSCVTRVWPNNRSRQNADIRHSTSAVRAESRAEVGDLTAKGVLAADPVLA